MQKLLNNLLEKAIIFLLMLAVYSSSVYSQQFSGKIMFLQAAGAPNDQVVIDKLISWGFQVDIVTTADFKVGIPTDDEIKAYKMAYISESVGSGDLARWRGATRGKWETGWLPVPVVNNDNFVSRVSALGFVSGSTGYGNQSNDHVVIIDNTNHPLAAGYTAGTTLDFFSDVTNGTYTYATPDPSVQVIPIAALASDNTKLVCFGVEKGTAVFNSDGVNDGSVKTTARYAAVGINATSYNILTDHAWKMIAAAIEWVLTPPETDVKDYSSTVPTKFELAQNFPNPFNPTTQISYQLPENSFVTLKVYDILGKEVETLVNGYKNAGNYTVTFDASKLTSGVYFYTIQANNFTQTKKMLLIK